MKRSVFATVAALADLAVVCSVGFVHAEERSDVAAGVPAVVADGRAVAEGVAAAAGSVFRKPAADGLEEDAEGSGGGEGEEVSDAFQALLSGMGAVLLLLAYWGLRWFHNVIDPPSLSYEEWEREARGECGNTINRGASGIVGRKSEPIAGQGVHASTVGSREGSRDEGLRSGESRSGDGEGSCGGDRVRTGYGDTPVTSGSHVRVLSPLETYGLLPSEEQEGWLLLVEAQNQAFCSRCLPGITLPTSGVEAMSPSPEAVKFAREWLGRALRVVEELDGKGGPDVRKVSLGSALAGDSGKSIGVSRHDDMKATLERAHGGVHRELGSGGKEAGR